MLKEYWVTSKLLRSCPKPQFGSKSALALPSPNFSQIAHSDLHMFNLQKMEPALRSSNFDLDAGFGTASKSGNRSKFYKVSYCGKSFHRSRMSPSKKLGAFHVVYSGVVHSKSHRFFGFALKERCERIVSPFSQQIEKIQAQDE